MAKNKNTKAVAEAPARNTNAMAIKWPTDPWGFTRELRKAVCIAASRCAGSEEKKRLLDNTLEVAMEFLDASHEKKAGRKAALMDKARKEHVKTPAVKQSKPIMEAANEPNEDAIETEEDALEGEALEDALFGDEEEMEDK